MTNKINDQKITKTFKYAIGIVSDATGLSAHNILNPSSRSEIAARHLVFWVIRNRTDFSFPKIAAAFNMDHSTILYGVRKIEKIINSSDWLDKTIKEISRLELHLRHGAGMFDFSCTPEMQTNMARKIHQLALNNQKG